MRLIALSAALALAVPAGAETTVAIHNRTGLDLLVTWAEPLGRAPLAVTGVCTMPAPGPCDCPGLPEFGGRLYSPDPQEGRPEFEYVVPAGEARAFRWEEGQGRQYRLDVRGPLGPGPLAAHGLLVYPYPCLPWAVPAGAW